MQVANAYPKANHCAKKSQEDNDYHICQLTSIHYEITIQYATFKVPSHQNTYNLYENVSYSNFFKVKLIPQKECITNTILYIAIFCHSDLHSSNISSQAILISR